MLSATPVSADWLVELPGSPTEVSIKDTAVDAAGNLTILGEFSGTVDFDPTAGLHELTSTYPTDLFVAKYDTSGTLINAVDVGDFQITQFNGSRRVDVDNAGNVYFTSGYQGEAQLLGGHVLPAAEAGDEAALFAKLDSALSTVVWARDVSPTGWGPYANGEIRVNDIGVDAAGSGVYVAGELGGEVTLDGINVKTAWDGFTMRINASTGAFDWVDAYSDKSWRNAIEVDPLNPDAVYVIKANYDETTLQRLNASGNLVWQTSFDSNIAWYDARIAVQDNVFLTSSFAGEATVGQSTLTSAGSSDALIAGIDAATGSVIWANQAGGAGEDRPTNIATDADANLFVSGTFTGVATFGNDTLTESTTSDVFLSQLEATDGSFLQSWRYGPASISRLAATNGSMYAVGSYDAATTDLPTEVTASSSSGSHLYMMRFTEATDPTVPRINGFVASPDPAVQGSPIALSAVGMHDPDQRVDSVAFYHDADGDRRLNLAVDSLLGADTDGSDGWEIGVVTASLPLGQVQFLAQATYDGGSLTPTINATTLLQIASMTYASNDVGQTIRDLTTVTSTITVPDSFVLDDVDVTVSITHRANTDLDVFLIHPDGTRIELFTDVGGFSSNFVDSTLDDQADTSITSGTAPFTGRYRPEGLLSALNGKDAAGVWTLEITDDERKDTGTLDAWSLALVPQSPPAPSFQIDDVAVTEGDGGTVTADFTVTRSGDLNQAVTVDYETANGTATAGNDYVAINLTTLSFDPGVASLPVTVVVNGDVEEESDETFFVNLSNPVGASISDAQGVGTIIDNDGVVELGALYVYDISFDSKRGGKDYRAVFEIRSDSDGDGQATANDDSVAGVFVTVSFAGETYTGVTDSSGVFRTSWQRNLASGNYYANAVDLALEDFEWNPFELDLEDDSDGDGRPDAFLAV